MKNLNYIKNCNDNVCNIKVSGENADIHILSAKYDMNC